MSNTYEQIDEDTWYAKYKPIVNHLDPNASWSGYMFETYGEEEEFIKQYPNERCIWTYMDTGDGGTCVGAGWHFVNRIGYFITENEWTDEDLSNFCLIVIEPTCGECEGNPNECCCKECGECMITDPHQCEETNADLSTLS